MNETDDFFIDCASLADRIDTVKIVDGSWYLPSMGRDGKAEYDAARLPGAQYFDINVIADTSVDLPHMLPSPEVFCEAVGKMGINETDEVVVYDGPGLFSSARVWWTFRVMGAAKVKILSGGLDGWKAAGLELETGNPNEPDKAEFKHAFTAEKVRDLDYMKTNVRRGNTLVLDARPFGRFTGEVDEPRPGLRRGHIPGSRSLPASDLIGKGRLLPADELRQQFDAVGLQHAGHVTTSCGSGVTAAILSLALESIGYRDHSLYDGSWADWGSHLDVPVARWK